MAEWQEAMGAVEFRQWEAWLDSVERWNQPHREDHLFATLAHMIYLLPVNFFGNKGGAALLKARDFLTKFAPAEGTKPPTREEAMATAKAQEDAMIRAIQASAAGAKAKAAAPRPPAPKKKPVLPPRGRGRK